MKTPCSQCSKEFETHPYKLKRHKNLFCSTICQHKFRQNRVNLTCRVCEKPFQMPANRVKNQKECFCSRECANKASVVPRISRTCETCGKSFEFLESRLKHSNRKYCSSKCSVNRKSNSVEKTCETCSTKFRICPSAIKDGRGRFCSRNCYNTFCVGENSPHYKHGAGVFKKMTRDSRGDTCTACKKVGKTEIHHIDGNMFNNVKSNYITLCRSCHSRIHSISGKHGIEISRSLEIFKLVIDLPQREHYTWHLIEKLKKALPAQ